MAELPPGFTLIDEPQKAAQLPAGFTLVEQPVPEQPGKLMSAARGAMQGLTFGLADESYGLTQGVKGLFTGEGFGAGYTRGRDEYRARDKVAKEANPISSTAGEVVGGLGTGLGAAKAGLTLVKAGMGLPRMALAGATEGAAYGALHGAGNAEGDLDARIAGAQQGALTGAAVGGAVPVIARGIGSVLGAKVPTAGIPTADELAVAKRAAYRAADNAGVVYTPNAVSRINADVARELTDIGFDPALQPGATVALKRIQDLAGQNVTLTGLETIRKIAGNGYVPGNKSNNLAVSKIVEALDNVTTGPRAGEVLMGKADEGAAALTEARALASREAKATKLADALYAAELRSSASGSGGNVDNASRQRIATLLLDKSKSRGFTGDEREALEQIVKGSKGQNLARLVGKLSPNGNGLMLAGNLYAAGQTGGMSLPAAALGTAAKTIADGATMRNAAIADALIRSGGIKANMPANKQREAVEAVARALLMGGGETQSQKLYSPRF